MKYPDLFNPDLSRIGVQESQMYNLVAGTLMTQIVHTSLGPRGMSKVYIDILGEETITSRGGAFLRKVDVDHPAAKAVVDAVNTVDNHVGDGTATTAVLAGSLLARAKEMLCMRMPTASIIAGFEAGMDMALCSLKRIRFAADPSNRDTMYRLMQCCMAGSALEDASYLSKHTDMYGMITDAIYHTSDIGMRRMRVDDVKIEEKPGSESDTTLVLGTVIDKPADNADMPRAIRDARILVVSEPLERSRTKTESEIEINSPEQMGAFLHQESKNVRNIVHGVIKSGANVVISRKGIDKETQEALARRGIMSVRRVKHNDIWWLEKSTGAVTCTDIEEISSAELGHAARVYQDVVGGDKMVFVESGVGGAGASADAAAGPMSVTLLLRANSKRYLDEFHRTALNALHTARDFVEHPYLVYGGGSCEAMLAHMIRDQAGRIPGKKQVSVMGFADALEDIPMTLAENAGMQKLDALPKLRFMTSQACAKCDAKIITDTCSSDEYSSDTHAQKNKKACVGQHGAASGNRNVESTSASAPLQWYGIDHLSREVCDMSCSGCNVIEPYVVKVQVIKSAVEAACAILNVDDVFVKDLIDNTHCHIDGTVHAHKDPGKNHNHWEQEGLEQRQMHHYY